MGAGPSQPTDSTKHVFTSDVAVNYSPELIDSLQASTESNSTRAKSLDLHISQRVAAELEKLQSKERSALDSARSKIASGESDSSSSEPKSKSKGGLPELPSLLPSLTGTSDAQKKENERKAQTSKKVQEEIAKLKAELGQRKVLKTLPKEVESAREGVVSCLRVNDRRPLDCWREIEVFKREVKRLEDDFVAKVL